MRSPDRKWIAAAVMVGALLAPSSTEAAVKTPPKEKELDATLVIVGDIASCKVTDDDKLARVAEKLLAENDKAVLVTLGDTAYPKGRPEDFKKCYDPSWGKQKNRTYPVIGNHEYEGSTTADGYFNYFGEAAGEKGKGYYPKSLGKKWRGYMLNSEREFIGKTEWKNQTKWLQKDVKNHPSQFKIAFAHHPYVSSGLHGGDNDMKVFWNILYPNNKAKLMFSGHDHHGEIFSPQTPDKKRDYNAGIRQVVMGTGGAYYYDVGRPVKHSVFQLEQTPAVTKLDLYTDGSYKGEIVTLEKVVYTFTDTSK